MNKKVRISLIAVMLAATTLYAADSGPGTSSDPLVTKSYVDKKIAESGNAGVSVNIAAQLKAQEQLIKTLSAELNTLKQQQNNTYTVVSVPEGKIIFGKQGTEIIIRSGEAQVISAQAGGLQDMTEGTDISASSLAPRYHLIIIPREDGRGLLATKTLTLMVRGGYTIQ